MRGAHEGLWGARLGEICHFARPQPQSQLHPTLGLLHAHEDWDETMMVYCKVARCVLWSTGLNLHKGRNVSGPESVESVQDRQALDAIFNLSVASRDNRPSTTHHGHHRQDEPTLTVPSPKYHTSFHVLDRHILPFYTRDVPF